MASRMVSFAGVVSLAVVGLVSQSFAQSQAAFGQGAFRPGDGISPPALIRQVEPKYTQDAMRAKIQGDVELEVVVTADGKVGDVRVMRSLDDRFGLDENAIMAAKQWVFTPAHDRDGRAVPVIVTLILSYRTAKPTTLGATQFPDDDFVKGACRVPSEGATSPKLVDQVEPKYTSDALRAKVEGTVTVEAIVNADGTVARARVTKSLDKLYGLDEQALMAVSHWTFEPDSGKCQGLSAPTLVTLVLNFRIH
ncbi:MAG TPA: energy transducer TonB [Vicinamibacterales bacterium]|nr:energy transducer TonB [Vicinamibacterales bacterium]